MGLIEQKMFARIIDGGRKRSKLSPLHELTVVYLFEWNREFFEESNISFLKLYSKFRHGKIETCFHSWKCIPLLIIMNSYLLKENVPDSWDWNNVDGKSYLTKMLNQHLPHYCGSCWAHGAVSALSDRIKIARNGEGYDINLSIQWVLNCGSDTAGSCHGGYHTGVYELIQQFGYIPYDT